MKPRNELLDKQPLRVTAMADLDFVRFKLI